MSISTWIAKVVYNTGVQLLLCVSIYSFCIEKPPFPDDYHSTNSWAMRRYVIDRAKLGSLALWRLLKKPKQFTAEVDLPLSIKIDLYVYFKFSLHISVSNQILWPIQYSAGGYLHLQLH